MRVKANDKSERNAGGYSYCDFPDYGDEAKLPQWII
jgi:hypothetical protein